MIFVVAYDNNIYNVNNLCTINAEALNWQSNKSPSILYWEESGRVIFVFRCELINFGCCKNHLGIEHAQNPRAICYGLSHHELKWGMPGAWPMKCFPTPSVPLWDILNLHVQVLSCIYFRCFI